MTTTTTTINKYRFFCTVHDEYKSFWSIEDDLQNQLDVMSAAGYVVQSGSLTVIDTITESVVHAEIVEENVPTNGYYQTTTEVIVMSGIGEESASLSWPYPVSLIKGTLYLTGDEVGDKYEVYIAPNTIVGTVTSGVVSGTSILPVSPTVIENVDVGFDVALAGIQELGRVLAKDSTNFTITVETPPTSDVSEGIPVSMTIKLVKFLELGPFDKIEIGGSSAKAKYLPAGTPLVLKYISNTEGMKYAALQLEYYY